MRCGPECPVGLARCHRRPAPPRRFYLARSASRRPGSLRPARAAQRPWTLQPRQHVTQARDPQTQRVMCGLTGLVWFYGRWDSWEKAESVLTMAWVFPDGRGEAARAYLATAVQAPVDRLPPSQLMRCSPGPASTWLRCSPCSAAMTCSRDRYLPLLLAPRPGGCDHQVRRVYRGKPPWATRYRRCKSSSAAPDLSVTAHRITSWLTSSSTRRSSAD
jgi:hypothetical protein